LHLTVASVHYSQVAISLITRECRARALVLSRTVVEQLNARLKGDFAGRLIYVRGATGIMAHLMFGAVVLTVDQLLRLSC